MYRKNSKIHRVFVGTDDVDSAVKEGGPLARVISNMENIEF